MKRRESKAGSGYARSGRERLSRIWGFFQRSTRGAGPREDSERGTLGERELPGVVRESVQDGGYDENRFDASADLAPAELTRADAAAPRHREVGRKR
jgi:hypothetical protein